MQNANYVCMYLLCCLCSQVVAIISYGLFGHALTLIICNVGSDSWFMPLMTVIGGLGKHIIIIAAIMHFAHEIIQEMLCFRISKDLPNSSCSNANSSVYVCPLYTSGYYSFIMFGIPSFYDNEKRLLK